MVMPDETPAADTAPASPGEVTNIVKVLFLLVVAGMVLSMSFNAYLLVENMALRKGVADAYALRESAKRGEKVEDFAKKLVGDLQFLGRTDKKAKGLLLKHQRDIVMLRLIPVYVKRGSGRPDPGHP